MVLGRNWESLEMFKEHCLELKRGMSSKIIVKSYGCFLWRIIAIKGERCCCVCVTAVQIPGPFQPSFSGTSELGYVFLVPEEMTIFCSLWISCQLLFLQCQLCLKLQFNKTDGRGLCEVSWGHGWEWNWSQVRQVHSFTQDKAFFPTGNIQEGPKANVASVLVPSTETSPNM